MRSSLVSLSLLMLWQFCLPLSARAEDLDEANRLNSELADLYRQGNYAGASKIGERVLIIFEDAYGAEHPNTVTALNNLAALYQNMGDYARAEPLFRRALTIREKTLGPAHSLTATSLNNLATLYQAMGSYVRAEPLFQRALAIREKAQGEEHPDTAISLNNLATLYNEMGDYARAEPLYNRALAIREHVLDPLDPAIATSLHNLASLQEDLGNYLQAEPLLNRALSIRERTLGPEHPDTATSLNNLGLLYLDMGSYARAEPLLNRAVAIREKTIGPEHPDTAVSLNNLALLYGTMGDYARAEPLYRRALSIAETSLGAEHPDTTVALNNLALLYEGIGDLAQAEPLLKRALAIREKSFGPEHPETAVSLNNLALLYEGKGDRLQAASLHRRSLTIRKKVLGVDHPATATSLNNLGMLYEATGEFARAEPLLKRALAIREKSLGPEHPDTAVLLSNLAMLHKARKGYAQAEPLFRRALAIREKTLGLEHPDTAMSQHNLALELGTVDKDGEALALFLHGLEAQNRTIANVFTIATEQQKLQFVRQSSWGYEGLLSLIHRKFSLKQEALHAGLDAVLSRKGIIFDAQAHQNEAIAASLDPETKMAWNDLAATRAALAKFLRNGPGKLSIEAYRQRLDDLNGQIGRLEVVLASKSALVAGELAKRRVTAAQLASQLPAKSVLAEFVRIHDYDWSHGSWAGTQRYLAFVLKPDQRLDLVDLGDADALDARLTELLHRLIQPRFSRAQTEAAGELYRRVWQPVAKVAGDLSRAVVSPDGALNFVPFAALMGADGKYLVETLEFTYVTSGRDLAATGGFQPELGLFLAANPAYEKTIAPDAIPSPVRGAVRARDFGIRFDPLPGTALEARQIPRLLAGGKNTVVTAMEATEGAVLSAKRPRILHLATHGFFLPDLPKAGVDETHPERNRSTIMPERYENPLVRSGLAFAGANHATEAEGSEDGLLTALEVSGMDLHGTELVTLSACETALGDVKAGEGVYGLRRAFSLAGTRNLMMSLWPVSDDITARQMLTFYKLYGKGRSAAEALRAAQLETIAMLRKHFGGNAQPVLWAPFIMQGAPGRE
jgi:tetratricopeptide (TPR) repeat protein